MNEVDVLVGKLKEKHGEKYTPVQLNCWAHMINTHKHDSGLATKEVIFWEEKV